MTIRPIVRYPDRRLALPARPVTAFDDGLREPRAGPARDDARRARDRHHRPAYRRALARRRARARRRGGPLTYVNPVVEWTSPEMIMHREGSVSMPGVNDEVQRHARVRISYRDLDGNTRTEESEALRAVCHQHEIDQLDGLFWIQRLSRLKRERLVKKYEKMMRNA